MNATKVITIIGESCNGCDKCMKRCPTEAIRVRDGKAVINYDRCVGCGECVRVCPTHSKAEHYDPFEMINDYKYKVVLVSSSLYVQFPNISDVNVLLTGLKKMGFDDVFEVAVGVEYVINATRKLIKSKEATKPIISTMCPAIKNLVLNKYENIADHLAPIVQPEKYAARLALDIALKKTGLDRKDIGIFVITPCGANVMELKENAADLIDGVLSTREIYFPLRAIIGKIKRDEVENLCIASTKGIVCASNSGSSSYINTDRYITASGVEGVISVLNEMDHDRLDSLDYVELFACSTGCTGGSMNVENCFLARARMRMMAKHLSNKMNFRPVKRRSIKEKPYRINNVYKLSNNFMEALKMTKRMNEIYDKLPKLNCGYCGAPSCRAFAEDYVKGEKLKCKYYEVKEEVAKEEKQDER